MIITRADGVQQNPDPDVDPGPPRVDTSGAPDVAPLEWAWTAPWLGYGWELTDLNSPVVKLRGATGIGGTTPEHWWTEAPTMDGAQWGGYRTPRGELFMPLMVRGNDSKDFMEQHRRFRQALNPSKESVLTIARPDGISRWTHCRYASGADSPITLDPAALCRATYGITWSTDPYWFGEPVTRRFEYQATPAPFFPGPPFTITRGYSLTNATVDNPGDVSTYPTWRIYAPFTAFSVGIGDSLLSLALSKPDGWIDVDMNPDKLTVVNQAGSDWWSAATAAAFSEIPPGEDIPLNLTVSGPGEGTAIELSFTPRYWSAL